METSNQRLSLRDVLDRRVVVMLFLGFSAGLPILLIFGTLSVWLREAEVSRSTVTLFSWAALGYSFKFVWAPLVDQLRLPLLTSWLGRRRGWLLLSQMLLLVAIWIMSSADPATGRQALIILALGAVLLGFSSATQDIVIDAFRIELAQARMQALLSSTYIAGYRIAMILAGAGGLFLAEYLGSDAGQYDYAAWQITYRFMGAAMLVGIVTTLVISEPAGTRKSPFSLRQNSQLLLLFVICAAGFVGAYVALSDGVEALKEGLDAVFSNRPLASVCAETLRLGFGVFTAWCLAQLLIRVRLVSRPVLIAGYVAPVQDFFNRYGVSNAWLLLALIGLYRISDIVLGVIANVFYYDLGFSKSEIAEVAKTFGVLMTIVGGFLGGVLAFRFGVIRILLLGALLSAVTNLLFVLMANLGQDINMLYVVIGADNLSAGIASAAFIAFLSALTNVNFTAMQYAIFSSLMTLLPKILGGYSGAMVDQIGYPNFFLFTALIGLPVLGVIVLAAKKLELDVDTPSDRAVKPNQTTD